MSKPHLLIAEVDKIQSFIFRSARRREVVGASYLLKEFGEDDIREMRPTPVDVLTSRGGSFRLVFASREDALAAGRWLEREFMQRISGTITVAPPVEYDKHDSRASIRAGNQALRAAKLAGRAPEPEWHNPLQAICASCGVELAGKFWAEYPEESPQYLCVTCREKARADWFDLFKDFRQALSHSQGGGWVHLPELAVEADTYARGWDPRNYVAYMLADGNHMGKLFDYCNAEGTKRLSEAVTDITTQSLADATYGMMYQKPGWTDIMPCLPLIIGGDDLFVLMPAPWAYDVAARYCVAYTEGMQQKVNQLHTDGHLVNEDDPNNHVPQVSVGVAIVICKATYPYKLAHQHGERLLEAAKDAAKRSGIPEQDIPPRSMLTVDLITGSDVTGGVQRHTPEIYDVATTGRVLEWRYNLREVANRTLEDLRFQFSEHLDELKTQSIEPALSRVREVAPKSHSMLMQAIGELGPRSVFDLLNHWDFAYDLRIVRENYMKVTDQR